MMRAISAEDFISARNCSTRINADRSLISSHQAPPGTHSSCWRWGSQARTGFGSRHGAPPPFFWGWRRRIQWVAPVSAAGFSWIYRWHGPIQAVADGVGAQPLPEVGQSISPVLEGDTCNSGIMLLHGGSSTRLSRCSRSSWRPSEWCKSPGPQPGVAGLSVRTSGDRLHG
jgi:hypothetical protein